MKKFVAFILLLSTSVVSFAQLSNASNTSRERSRDESRSIRSGEENRNQNSLDVSLNLNQLILSRYVAIFEMNNYESICKRPKDEIGGDAFQQMKFVTNPLLSFPVVNADGAVPYQWQEIASKGIVFGNSFDRYLMNHRAVAVKHYLNMTMLSDRIITRTAESLKNLKTVDFDDAKRHVDLSLCSVQIFEEFESMIAKHFRNDVVINCGKEVRYGRDPNKLSCDSPGNFNINVDADSRTILINGTPTLSPEFINGHKYVLNYSNSRSKFNSSESTRTDSKKSSQSSTKRQSGAQ